MAPNIPQSVLARRPTRPLTVAEYQNIKSGSIEQPIESPTGTPEGATSELQNTINSNVTEINNKIKDYENKLIEAEAFLRSEYEYYKKQSKKYPKDEKKLRAKYEQKKERFETKSKEYNYQISYLKDGLNYATQGYELNSIYKYVDSQVDYFMAKREARQRAEEQVNQARKELEGKYITPSGFVTPYKPEGEYAKSFQPVQIKVPNQKPITYFQYVKPQDKLELSRPDLQSREPTKIEGYDYNVNLSGLNEVNAQNQKSTIGEKRKEFYTKYEPYDLKLSTVAKVTSKGVSEFSKQAGESTEANLRNLGFKDIKYKGLNRQGITERTIGASTVGKAQQVATEFALYATPVLGATALAGTALESYELIESPKEAYETLKKPQSSYKREQTKSGLIGLGFVTAGAGLYGASKTYSYLKKPYNVEIELPKFKESMSASEVTLQGEKFVGKGARITVEAEPTLSTKVSRYNWFKAKLTDGKLKIPKERFEANINLNIIEDSFKFKGKKSSAISDTTSKRFGEGKTLKKYQQSISDSKPVKLDEGKKLSGEAEYLKKNLPARELPEGTQTYATISKTYEGTGKGTKAVYLKKGTDVKVSIPIRKLRESRTQAQYNFITGAVKPEYSKSITRVKRVGKFGDGEVYVFESAGKTTKKPRGIARGNVDYEQGTTLVRRIEEPVNVKKLDIKQKEKFVELFHGTTEESAKSIFKKGFSKKVKGQGINKLDDIYLTTDKEAALGYANRAAINKIKFGQSAKPEVVSLKVPKSAFKEALARQGGVGRLGEVKFNRVPKEWIKTNKPSLKQVPKRETESIVAQIQSISPKRTSRKVSRVRLSTKGKVTSFTRTPSSYFGVGGLRSNEQENVGVLSFNKFAFGSSTLPSTRTRDREELDFLTITREGLDQPNVFRTREDERSREGQILITPQAQAPALETPLLQDTPNVPDLFIPRTPDRPRTPEVPKVPKRPIPDLTFPGEKRKEEVGYDSYVYVDATKRNKAFYKKLNRVPLTQESALSMTAREVDKTISARGKIAKAKPVKQRGRIVKATVMNTRDKYYSENQYKFRSYSGRKMKPLPTGTIIEREKFRLDSRGEVKKIQKEKAKSVRSVFGF